MNYIQLLEESKVHLMEILKVSDDSVADYKLQIEITIKFIDKALETEDRLDIFRALQKTYDVLETEYEEEYDDLVDRIEKALSGLHENTIKPSDLKKLTKLILKEIALVQPKPESFFSFLRKHIEQSNPAINDSLKAEEFSKHLVSTLRTNIKIIIKLSAQKSKMDKKSNKNISDAVNNFNYNRNELLQILIIWARKIDDESKDKRNEVNEIMNEVRIHIEQIGFYSYQIIDDLRIYKSYINARNKVKHLEEIFDNTNKSVDSLFKIAKSVGL